jgi:hypothetical protein
MPRKPARALRSPRPGRNLGLGRERRHPPGPFLARSLLVVHLIRRSSVVLGGSKTAESASHPLNPKTFALSVFSLSPRAAAEQRQSSHGGRRRRWGKPLPERIRLLPILLSSLFRGARSTAQNPAAEPAMASAATQSDPDPREKKSVAAPPSGPWPARASTQGWARHRPAASRRRPEGARE